MCPPSGRRTINFAFANATGNPSPVTFYDPASRPHITITNQDVTVLAVYVEIGGNGGGTDYGATIDAFSTSLNALISDTFVTVAPDPSGGEASSGNVYGWVDTTDSAETITAINHVTPSDADFQQWVDLSSPLAAPPGVNILGADLEVNEEASTIALWFYKSSPAPIVVPVTPMAEWVRREDPRSLLTRTAEP